MAYELHYTGYGYPSMEEIEDEAMTRGLTHSYWASEIGFSGLYNGDTVVVYDNTDGMYEGMKEDAEKYGKPIAERRAERQKHNKIQELVDKLEASGESYDSEQDGPDLG